MGEGQGQERTQLADDRDKSAAELRAEIEDVREDIGDTAAALAAKTDVKARARGRAEEIKRNATAKKDDLLGGSQAADQAGSAIDRVRTTARENPVPTVAIGALAGGFLVGWLLGRGD